MSSVFDDKYAYLHSPYYKEQKVGDFTPFYITITICTILGISIFLLNIVLGCCSRYSEYWNDKHTGNRWIISLWTTTPHRQPALDYSELEGVHIVPEHQVVYHHPPAQQAPAEELLQLTTSTKRESDI